MCASASYSSFENLSNHISEKFYHVGADRIHHVKFHYDKWKENGVEAAEYFTLADSSSVIASESGLIITALKIGTFTINIREVLEARLEERAWSESGTSFSNGSISGATGATLGGAIIGGILTGGVGAVVGGIAGHSKKRTTQNKTTTENFSVKHVDVVKVYTANMNYPYFSLQFQSNDDASKFYGFINAVIHNYKITSTDAALGAERHTPERNNKETSKILFTPEEGMEFDLGELDKFEKSLSEGDTNAYYYIGIIYLHNNEQSGNLKKAANYFKSGAQKGHPYCAAELSILLFDSPKHKKDCMKPWEVFFTNLTLMDFNLGTEIDYACRYIEMCIEMNDEITYTNQLKKLKYRYLSLPKESKNVLDYTQNTVELEIVYDEGFNYLLTEFDV